MSGDFKHVVNAYEQHEHVYEDLKKKGGTVLIRGRGIVASRIIQKISETRRDHNADIRVLHLMRKPLSAGAKYGDYSAGSPSFRKVDSQKIWFWAGANF